jgi:hypothetical protein
MNLFKIGDMTLNMDRVNGIQDHVTVSDPGAATGRTVIRILFDVSHIDLDGIDAQVLRRWIRHNARNLAPHKDEEGQELMPPEEQLRRVADHLVALVDRVRPRDPSLRGTAHRLSNMLNEYMTGQLHPVGIKNFERQFEALRPESSTVQDASAP